ncbi:MAG TPA: hemerythrin domain-containing protein [Syntrophorhabdaceae bacterium]|nr:hemerythrin domain-containing protein [Syntrophorhabdaceae bacterium]
MSLIEWDDKFSVGIQEVDEHAKQFVCLLNLIKEDFALGVSDTTRDTLLSTLRSFCQFHFEYEERLMRKMAFPGLLAHKEDHNSFFDSVTASSNLLQDEFGEVLQEMGRWAHRHFGQLHAELKQYGGGASGPGTFDGA